MKRLLIVEDNPADELLLREALALTGLAVAVQVMRDGQEALDGLLAARATPELPDAILMDIKLPKLSGLDVLAALRADRRTRNLPIIIFSSSREEGDLRRAYERGANSYLVKPIDFATYSRVVAAFASYWLVWNEAAPTCAPEEARS